MADKLPFMPFYGSDFYDDEAVCLMSSEEEAIYLRLLWRQWREGSLPSEQQELQGLLQGKPGLSPRVLARFPRSEDGRRRNPKLERVREQHLQVYEKKSEGGKVGRARQLATAEPPTTRAKRRGKPRESPGSGRGVLGESESESESEVKTTWLTPFADAWQARFGGEPDYGQMARYLKPVVAKTGEAETVARLARYLDQTEARYVSLKRFSETHAAYAAPDTLEMTDAFGEMRKWRREPDGCVVTADAGPVCRMRMGADGWEDTAA